MLRTRMLFARPRKTSTTVWSAPRGKEVGHCGVEEWVGSHEGTAVGIPDAGERRAYVEFNGSERRTRAD